VLEVPRLRSLAALCLASSLLGCGVFDGDIQYEIDSSFSEADVVAIRTAAEKWNSVADRKLLLAGRGELIVLNAHTPEGYNGLHQRRFGIIRIDPDAPRDRVYAIALHEFGHALGLRHQGRGVMAGAGAAEELPAIEFTEEDLAECRRQWVC
jgi:predicted Zn-dependent protease